jgi:hypothetical protein
VDVAGVKPQLLRNVGLLVATMKDASTNGDIVEIKMVTQVMNKNDGSLIRNVIDPLE